MHHRRTLKPATDRAIKKSVSMPLAMFIRAREIQQKQLQPAFSDYLQGLVRADIQRCDTSH